MKELSLTEMTIKIPPELQFQAQKIAEKQGETLSNIIRTALETYITAYQQEDENVKQETSLADARILMRELGKGLAEGNPRHDIARNHDLYIYSKSI